jgi:acyl carrier protein
MGPEDIVRALVVFVNGHIMSRRRPIEADDAFETVGVDSIAFLKILLFIEAEFGFWMPDEDLVDENLATPRALASYIHHHRSRSS